MKGFKLFDTQKIEFHSTRRSPYHFSPIKALNGIGDQTRYSPLLKQANRTEFGTTLPKQRSESTDEKQLYSSPKLNKLYRISKRSSNAPLKATDTGYARGFPKTWENNSEITHSNNTDSNMRASPESRRHRLTADGIHNNRTCPTIVHDDTLKMKMGVTTLDEVIGKLGTEKEPDYFIYTVGKGNNDQIIRKVMQRRYWWKETYTSNNIFHFSWQPTSRGIHYDKLFTHKGMRQIVNHYEFHAEISTKINLIKNLQTFCERASIDIFDITPTTFIIDFEDPSFTYHIQEFVSFFQKYSKIPADKASQIATTFPLASMRVQKQNMLNITSYSSVKPSKPKMQDTLYNGCNLWLLKPTEFNRGRGINLFNKLASLEYYLKCFQVGEYAAKWKNSPSSAKIGKDRDSAMNLVKSTKFVVQKYLEKPMLIDNRKFDIRVWVLLDHQMNLYFFREGYIRLSSEPFTLNETQIEDKYVHLTNNAIQKNGKNYGKHESGNIIPLHQLRTYLPKDKAKSDYIRIIDRIKEVIKISMKSGREKLNAKERKYCFEIFGFDFILDQLFNVWLIEINTNPCLEESNDLLKKLVPRMLDDAFKLTLDKLIVPTPKNFKPEDIKKAEACHPFSVVGYDNNENIWEHLANLRGVQIFCKLK